MPSQNLIHEPKNTDEIFNSTHSPNLLGNLERSKAHHNPPAISGRGNRLSGGL
jgi:hypothetical protein